VSGSRSASWRLMSLATRLVIAIAIAAALGFPVFVWSLARETIEPGPADGIVVLTGGEDRLPAAVKLLQAHKGNRLLISGVHQETTRKELLERVGGDPSLFSCCVDLGRSAGNTIGNAGETAAWAAENDYHSIIVVTASYHMPRTLLELQAVSPKIQFVAYPVFPEHVKLDHWWNDPQTSGVLIAEYGKYLASQVRVTAATTFGLTTATSNSPTIEHGSTAPVHASGAESAGASSK
jgi:uncharacterized SAM-binding protein YcdF (DUF218 family)